MKFNASLLSYDDSLRNTILDYNVALDPLKPEDSLFIWQSIGNYSLTGFEMTLRRNSLKYLVNYYLPSGLFVVVSWVGEDAKVDGTHHFLGRVPDPTGDCPRADDAAGHDLPRLDQHLQQCHLQLAQRGGLDSHIK